MPIYSSDGQEYESDFHFLMDKPTEENIPTAEKKFLSPQNGSQTGNPSYDFKAGEDPNYDYKAAEAAGEKPDERGHMTDKYKLPGHITFSDESLYHGKDGELGGEWRKNAEDKWTFTPGPSNYKNYSVQQMQDYFQKYEPDATLVLPPGIGGHFQNIDEKPPEKWTQPLSWGEFWNAVQSDSEIYNSVKRGLTAPGRALGGQEPTIADGLDMAGVVATGAVVPRPTNSLGLFGGRFAKEAEDLAVKMEGKGFKDVAIKKMTGLERGADGAWRNEIDDSKSVYKPENFQGGFAYTHEILDHPELYKNYPELKDVGVFEVNQVGDSPNNHGMFNPDQGHIQIKKGLPPEEAHATLIHEIQHYIQHKEGFAMGVPEQIPVELADKFKGYLLRTYAKEPIEKILAMAESGSVDKAREEAKKLLSDIDYLTYRSISSEQEAFNAQNRLKLSARARAENPGRYTEGMDRSEQLVVEPKGTQAGSPYSKAANDNSLFKEDFKTYDSALSEKQFKNLVEMHGSPITKDLHTWEKIATEENITAFKGKGSIPNPFSAAREYSRRENKPTMVLDNDGRRWVYFQGKRVFKDKK